MPTAPPAEAEGGSRPASLVAPVLAACLGLLAGDALRPPASQWSARAAVAAIDLYRGSVSPALASSGIVRCKFTPTCSAYGREAIARHGNPRGFALAAGRVLRCHPWARGGEDAVP